MTYPRLESIVQFAPVEIVELTQPWDTSTRTIVARPDRGGSVVVQWAHDRRGVARRIRLGRQLSWCAPWLPIPEILDGDARAAIPFVVSRYVPGQSGRTALDGEAQAARFCRRMGALARDISRVPIRGLRLSRTWADRARLEAAARRWLAGASDVLEPAALASIEPLLDALPPAFASADPVFAHGDFAPVNTIVRDGAIVALLDLERARIAHPYFDAAWFRLIVRSHHPDRWNVAGPAFLAAAGIAQTADEMRTLDLLAMLQCLESIASTPRSRAAVRHEWAARAMAVAASAPA